MLEDKPASRMLVEPSIQAKDVPFIDDNDTASSDQAFDVSPGENFACTHGVNWWLVKTAIDAVGVFGRDMAAGGLSRMKSIK